jgi:hypothetical protein
MTLVLETKKVSVFLVPAEVFAQLDPIEQIVIRAQAQRGEVRILEPGVSA